MITTSELNGTLALVLEVSIGTSIKTLVGLRMFHQAKSLLLSVDHERTLLTKLKQRYLND
jgi:hypothetical protein